MRSIKVLVLADSQPEVCISYGEVCSEILKTECFSFYCKNCLIRMATKSMQDEFLFPPKCCHKPIEGSDMKKVIGSALAQEQKKRAAELSDPDRTYCSDLKCSRYISPTTKFWLNFTFQTVGHMSVWHTYLQEMQEEYSRRRVSISARNVVGKSEEEEVMATVH